MTINQPRQTDQPGSQPMQLARCSATSERALFHEAEWIVIIIMLYIHRWWRNSSGLFMVFEPEKSIVCTIESMGIDERWASFLIITFCLRGIMWQRVICKNVLHFLLNIFLLRYPFHLITILDGELTSLPRIPAIPNSNLNCWALIYYW